MPNPRQPFRPVEPPPPPRRTAMRRATAERTSRILKRHTVGVSVAEIAGAERLAIRRVQQVIAEALASREGGPAAGFAPLQIAHAMMMTGDLPALDRFVRLVGERDRDHGFGRAEIAAPRALAAPAKQNARQAIENMESGEAADCATASP